MAEIKQIAIWTVHKDGRRFGPGPWPTTREGGENRLAEAQRTARAFAERARRPVATLTLVEETAWVLGHVQYNTREEAEAAAKAPPPRPAPDAGRRLLPSEIEAWQRHRFDD